MTMQIKYELDPYEDQSDLLLIQNRSHMYNALFDLDELRRQLSKGYIPFDQDSILERLNDIIMDSKIREIP